MTGVQTCALPISVTTHEVYDVASNSYAKRADMPTARNHSASGVINGKIYIVGGRTGSVFIPNAFNVDLVDEYDPASDQWSLKAPMPTPRHAVGATAIGDWIYVAGGGAVLGGSVQSAVHEAFTLS